MRRLTLAVLALGCLMLALGTFTGNSSISPVAVVKAVPTECDQPCSAQDSGISDKDDHFLFCHVDHGGEGHVICPDSSSIDHPHLDTHDTDFCITPNSGTTLADCEGKKGA